MEITTSVGLDVAECPVEIQAFAQAMDSHGFRLFAVGGWVQILVKLRAAQRGVVVPAGRCSTNPSDYDVTSPARPHEVTAIAASIPGVRVFPLGEDFGTVGILFRCADGTELVVEHTTHRRETYEDPTSRFPTVTFGDDLAEDLARRDFTVNAMACDLVTGEIVDPFGGVDDLIAGVLRTPAGTRSDNPERTFSEDPLRVMRLVRFAATRSMTVEASTFEGAKAVADRLAFISAERICAELRKTMAGSGTALVSACELTLELGAAEQVFRGIDIEAFCATIIRPEALSGVEDGLAALLVADGDVEASAAVLAEMKFSRNEIKASSAAASATVSLGDPESFGGFTAGAARRFLRSAGSDTSERALRVATALGGGSARFATLVAGALVEQPNAAERALPVDGNDVAATGRRGKEIGAALASIEVAFCANPALTRDEALALL